MKQIRLHAKVVLAEEVSRAAEEILLKRAARAFKRRCADGVLLEVLEEPLLHGEVQERVLPDDGVVALQNVLVVGIPPMAFDVGVIIHPRMAAPVAVPFGIPDAPAVFEGNEVAAGLDFTGNYAGRSRKAVGRLEARDQQRADFFIDRIRPGRKIFRERFAERPIQQVGVDVVNRPQRRLDQIAAGIENAPGVLNRRGLLGIDLPETAHFAAGFGGSRRHGEIFGSCPASRTASREPGCVVVTSGSVSISLGAAKSADFGSPEEPARAGGGED